MTVHGAWGAGRLIELDENECWELLGARPVGRVAFDDGDGPVIIPVNHMAADRVIRFRVSPHSTLGRQLDDRKIAFEVDDVDDFHRSGWSVVARGRAKITPGTTAWAEPTAWAAGVRTLVVELVPTSLTGRRVLGS